MLRAAPTTREMTCLLTASHFLAPRRAVYPARSLPPTVPRSSCVPTRHQLAGSLAGISVQNLKLQKCCFLLGAREKSCKHMEYPAKIHRKIIYSYVQPWGGFFFFSFLFWGFFLVGSFLFLRHWNPHPTQNNLPLSPQDRDGSCTNNTNT